jgi:hypothetical protein
MKIVRKFLIVAVCFAASLGVASSAGARGDGRPRPPRPEIDPPACGAGTLGFGAPIRIASRSQPPAPAVVFADLLNADDVHVDVGVARGNRLLSALGDGQGGFQPLAPVKVGHHGFLIGVATADLDADGVNDAALIDALQPSTAQVVHGTPDGRLGGAQRRIFLEHGYHPRAVVAADLDDDGLADVAVASYVERSLTVLLRRSSSPAHADFARAEVKLPLRPVDLVLADVDGDGALDLVAAAARGDLAVVLNRGGDFAQEKPRFVRMHAKSWSALAGAAAADLNGDGRVDLLSLLANGDLAVRLAEVVALPLPESVDPTAPPSFPSAGPPRFAAPVRSRLACAGHACGYAALAVGDVDRDGRRDLVAGARDVQVFFGRGDGSFALGPTLSIPGLQAFDLGLAELNGDRRPDVLVGAYDGSVAVVPTACACQAPFSGKACDVCERDPACPGGAAEQLAVGPPAIVRLGAQLVAGSLTPPHDPRAAARFAQQLAALGLESDLVVVAQPLRDRSELFANGDETMPFTITSFATERVLIGPAGLQEFEVAQEGGAVGDRVVDNPNTIPFPSADDLALCPGASEARTSAHWLLFLTALGDRAGAARVGLFGDLTLPALQVEMEDGQFVLRDHDSGIALSSDAIAAVLGGTR